MRTINSIFLIILLATIGFCQAQAKALEVSNECVISEYLIVKYPKSEEAESHSKEIGRFKVGNIGEGKEVLKTFNIPNSKLFIVASVFYDDDMYFNNTFNEALTITLVVSRSRKLTLSSTVSVGKTQVQYDENFKEINVETVSRNGNKLFDISMKCNRK